MWIPLSAGQPQGAQSNGNSSASAEAWLTLLSIFYMSQQEKDCEALF